MPDVRTSIVINRSREDVFDFIVDPETQMLWQSGLIEFTPEHEGEPYKGALSRGVVKVAGRKVEWTAEISEFDRPDRFSFRSIEAPFPFEFTTELHEVADGTEVRYFGKTEGMKGFFGKLTEPLVARMYERDVTANLANLKALLEEA